jgi:hypothetical protein
VGFTDQTAELEGKAIDRFLAGEDDLRDWKWHHEVTAGERDRLLLNFLQATRLDFPDAGSLELDTDEEAEARIEREKTCLHELAKKYQKIVDRWEQLTRLPFDDPQIEEATRTFLYGFYRATVVLCASAVETQLKRISSAPEPATVFELIKFAKENKLIQNRIAGNAEDLFRYRNRVAHDNREPEHAKAKEILVFARLLVEELRQLG